METNEKKLEVLPDSYVTSNTTTTRVVGLLPDRKDIFDINRKEDILKEYEAGRGYIDAEGKYVWIYKPMKPLGANELPYVWAEDIDSEHWHFVYSEPSPYMLDKYSYDNIVVLSSERINDIVNNEKPTFDEDEIMAIYASSSKFTPIVNEDDDGLKKLIKSYILKSGVNINAYKPKLAENYSLSNMKAALVNKTKMSMKYFNMWNEMFDTKYVIFMEDNKGNIMKYDSTTDKCESCNNMTLK